MNGFSELVDIGKRRNDAELVNIGYYARIIENQVLDGYPFVYMNIRILYESMINYIVFSKVKFKWVKNKNGYSSETLMEHLKTISEGGSFTKTLLKELPISVKKKDAINLYVKEGIVKYLYEEMGLSFGFFYKGEDCTQKFRQILNDEAHCFGKVFGDKSVIFQEISEIYSVLKNFHDTMYATFIESIAKGTLISEYQIPSDEEKEVIANKFLTKWNAET